MVNKTIIEEEDLKLISSLSSYLQNKYNISGELLNRLISQKQSTEIEIPTNIFTEKLGTLETIVKFLRENMNLKFIEIATSLNRNINTIITTYKKSKEKHPNRIILSEIKQTIPIKILKNRKLSTLENIVSYLREKVGLTNLDIANILHRDNRTIWTVYNRYLKKK